VPGRIDPLVTDGRPPAVKVAYATLIGVPEIERWLLEADAVRIASGNSVRRRPPT